MAANFKDLTEAQKAAVTSYVNREFDRIISEKPISYIAQNAQSDPEGWRTRFRELIAADDERVATIVRVEQMQGTPPSLGFTLIELSIVLVIVGLIVGGVLVGHDLIGAAGVRAQITQIEKYNTAANTFRAKYGYLPGDIKEPEASSFGFHSRGQYAGEGDGNGIIEGVWTNNPGTNSGGIEGGGETTMFWADLSAAHLIDGTFILASPTYTPGVSLNQISEYLPQAKLGSDSYVYVWSGGIGGTDNTNYYEVQALTSIGNSGVNAPSSPGFSVQQAYSIDKKIDDGYPQSGRVLATFMNWGLLWNTELWAAGGGNQGATSGWPDFGPTTSATIGSATTCYDNGNVAGASQQYSLGISGGANVNCALSFRFQ